MDSIRKPFKICNTKRNKLKGIVVGSLQELKERASELLGLEGANIRVFLDDDGTEIEDDEYLRSLNDQTKLVVTDGGEEWTASNEVLLLQRTATFSPSFESNESLEVNDDIDAAVPVSDFLLKQIKRNPIYFVSFSDEQLQSVVDCDVSFLARGLGMAENGAKFYQDTCQRELDKRAEMQSASELLKLYDKGARAQKVEPGTKKQKT